MSKILYIGSDRFQTPDTGYRDTVLLYLEMESGPRSPVLVSSLDELKFYFSSSNGNLSYKLAAKILSLGYRLLIYRICASYTSTSLRLFRKGGYSHPEEGRIYESNLSSNIKYLDDLSGTNLTHSSKITLNSTSYVYGDYVSLNIGNYNILYWFNPGGIETKPTIPADEFVEGYAITSTSYEDQLEEFKTLLSKSGFRIVDNETELIISRVNHYEFMNIATKDVIEKYDIGNFDVLCEILDRSGDYDNKCCDFYSRNPTSLNNIEISIGHQDLTGFATIEIRLYNSDNQLVIRESYVGTSDKITSDLINRINKNSRIVSAIFYNENVVSLSRSYRLDRIVKDDLTSTQIASLIASSDLPEYSFELVADSLFIHEDIQNAIYSKTKNTGALILFKSLDTSEVVSVPSGHKRDYNVLYLFPSYMEQATGDIYPAYIKYLELLSSDSFDGVITDIQKMDNRQFDDTITGISYEDFTYFIRLRRLLSAYGEYEDGEMSVATVSAYYPQSVLSVVRLINYVYLNLDTTNGELSIRDSFADRVALLKEMYPQSYQDIVLNDVTVVDESASLDVSIYFNLREEDLIRLKLSLDLR